MKRYLIFIGLGPLVGFLLACGEMYFFFTPPNPSWLLPGTIVAYVVGLIPAAIAALADSRWRNIAATAVVGAASSAMWPVVQFLLSGYGLEGMPAYAGIGMISAAVCSWLSRVG